MAIRQLTFPAVLSLCGTVLIAVSAASAEDIQLRGGGRVSGILVQKTDRSITIETSPGLVTLPMSRVESIVPSRSALQVWRERSSALADRDVEGWAALARWAQAQRLETQARLAWDHVLSLNPRHAEANEALGRVQVGGAWMSREDGYRAQGLVPFDGRWVARSEYQALVEQRTAEAAASLAQREAELRIREAQARAQEAEARARGAEAATAMSDAGGYGYGAVGYGYGGVGYGSGAYAGGRDHVGQGRPQSPFQGPFANMGYRYPRTFAGRVQPTPFGTTAIGLPPGTLRVAPRGALVVGPIASAPPSAAARAR